MTPPIRLARKDAAKKVVEAFDRTERELRRQLGLDYHIIEPDRLMSITMTYEMWNAIAQALHHLSED